MAKRSTKQVRKIRQAAHCAERRAAFEAAINDTAACLHNTYAYYIQAAKPNGNTGFAIALMDWAYEPPLIVVADKVFEDVVDPWKKKGLTPISVFVLDFGDMPQKEADLFLTAHGDWDTAICKYLVEHPGARELVDYQLFPHMLGDELDLTISVESDLIESVRYSTEEASLTVIFTSGEVEEYFGVCQYELVNLLESDSPDAYFNEHIRDRHYCESRAA